MGKEAEIRVADGGARLDSLTPSAGDAAFGGGVLGGRGSGKSVLAKLKSTAAEALKLLARAFAESAYWSPFAPLPWPLIDQRGTQAAALADDSGAPTSSPRRPATTSAPRDRRDSPVC
jgi:hypothetical protein